MITKEPFISIIMNCYNSSKYLKEAIDSVFAQTYTNWEIIFWDNQSTDQSAEIFKSYKDERCKYHYAPEHTTLGEARNLAVEKANGEWIAFLDCDDLWLPEKLEKQVAIIKKSDQRLGFVYGRAESLIMNDASNTKFALDIQKKKLIALPEGNIFNKLIIKNFVPLLTAVILKKAFIDVGGIDKRFRMAEDYDIFVKVARYYNVRALNEICSTYRIHQSNLTHSNRHIGYIESIRIEMRYPLNVYALIGAFINIAKYIYIKIRKNIKGQ